MASHGFNVLAVAFFVAKGSDSAPAGCPLDRFEEVFGWLETNPITKCKELYVCGGSIGAVLTILWLGRIFPAMVTGQFPPDVAGMTTLVSQGVDLGMVVPLTLSAGVSLGRSSPWGYLLAGIALTHGLMMFISIPAWIVVPLIQSGKTNLFEAIPFVVLSLIGIAVAGLFYTNVREAV